MVKSINNLNTLNALIKDEEKATREYYALSKGADVPPQMQRILLKMSQEEASHRMNLIKYKEQLMKVK